jgi:uncharacterized membrane protein
MSDLTLLVFGCTVSFIAVAGAYVYIREAFTAQARSRTEEEHHRAERKRGLRNVA